MDIIVYILASLIVFFIFFSPILLIIFLFSGILSNSKSNRIKSPYFYTRKNKVMTEREIIFYRKLQKVCGNSIYIFPQIHLSNLFWHKIKGQNFAHAFRYINRLSVDYVLVDSRDFKTLFAIELDDSTHNQPERQKRDKIVNYIFEKAGIPLLRINYITISEDELKQHVIKMLRKI
ncbi:MAG: DUF2726 domain-containing protein [bacterium]|nr:DUF2726 domain-containing protein [bacterium]